MKTPVLTLLFFNFCMSLSFAQSLEWATSLGGFNHDVGYTVGVDKNGNVFSAGLFRDMIDLDPGPDSTIVLSNGNNDMFVQKFDPQGNRLWFRHFGGPFQDEIRHIKVDEAGNVYCTGNFRGRVDFDPGPDSLIYESQAFSDIFILSLDPDGQFVSFITMPGSFGESGFALEFDQGKNIYLAGSMIRAAVGITKVDMDPGPDSSFLYPAGRNDVFIVKLDSSTQFQWAKRVGGIGVDYAVSMAINDSGHVYTTGIFEGKVDFDPGPDTLFLTAGFRNAFILKLDEQGNLMWAKNLGGAGSDVGLGICLGENQEVYATGQFEGTADFSPNPGEIVFTSRGGDDIFVQKLGAGGEIRWTRTLGGFSNENVNDIVYAPQGYVVLVGHAADSIRYAGGADSTWIQIKGGRDILIQKLDSLGNFMAPLFLGGKGAETGRAIALDEDEVFYLTGTFFDSIYLNPQADTTFLVAFGVQDVFVMKMSPDNPLGIDWPTVAPVLLYPNPNQGNFTLEVPEDFSSASMIIRNELGQVVDRQPIYRRKQALHLPPLPSG
ncbi:MAG: SBBP repeat-containing protein, partial [Bacteroidota bacterium]